jgi:hypothetical protein
MDKIMSYSLFPTNIYKVHIDPSNYNKEELVTKMLENYKIAPYRNRWDTSSVLHHTYNDGDNPKFHTVEGTDLIPVYGNIFVELINDLKLVKPLNFKFELANIAINTKYMEAHDHGSIDPNYQCIFSCVHYVKYNKDEHPNTTLVNPLKLSDENISFDRYCTSLNKKQADNSTYFDTWEIDVEEDDMIIFPSYLEHYVKSKFDADYLHPRIIVSLNVNIY